MTRPSPAAARRAQRASALACSCLLGCAAPGAPAGGATVAPPGALAPAAASVSSTDPPPDPARAALALEPGATVEFRAAALLAEGPSEHVERSLLVGGGQRVVPRAEAAPAVVLLDLQSPRPLRSPGGATLASLVDESEELAPGPHSLTVVRSVASGPLLFEQRGFSLEVRAAAPASACVLLWPLGTVNGPAPRAEVKLLAIAAPLVRSVRYRLEGDGRGGELSAPPAVEVRAPDLGSGDYVVSAECLGPSGETLGRASRALTVNRELESPP